MTDNRKIAQLRSENEALDLERREITGRLRRGGMLPVFGAAAILIGLTMVISSLAFVGWLVMLAGGGCCSGCSCSGARRAAGWRRLSRRSNTTRNKSGPKWVLIKGPSIAPAADRGPGMPRTRKNSWPNRKKACARSARC